MPIVTVSPNSAAAGKRRLSVLAEQVTISAGSVKYNIPQVREEQM
jgi:hypothetical protein